MKWVKLFLKAIAKLFRPCTRRQVPKKQKQDEKLVFSFKKGMLGVDISHHNQKVDLSVLARNVDFIYMKATEGATYVSASYVSRAKQLKKLNIPWGAYHYYRVNRTPVEQARHFLDYIDTNSGLPPVLDIEEINNNFKPQHRKDLIIFLRIIETKTKITPVIYTGYYFARDIFKPTDEFSKYKLWLPWYTSDFGAVRTPKPWENIAIWQYTRTGTIKGVEGSVDINKVV